MLQTSADPVRVIRTPPPSALPPGVELPRLPSVSNWSTTVLVFSVLLILYGLYLDISAYLQLGASQSSGYQNRNFGVVVDVINGVLCIIAGAYGVRAGTKRTQATAQDYLRLIGIAAAACIVLEGLNVIVAVVTNDCSDVSNAGGMLVRCSTPRGVILVLGLIGLGIVIGTCSCCICCARNLLNALITEAYFAGGYESGAIPFETYAVQQGAPAYYVAAPTAATAAVLPPSVMALPAAYPPQMHMYTGAPQGQVVMMPQMATGGIPEYPAATKL